MALLRRQSHAPPAKPVSDSVAKAVASSASVSKTSDEWHRISTTAPVTPAVPEAVNHPKHYNEHPKGIECIDVVEDMPFNTGNAIKYLWRCDHKGKDVEDLKKALWYVQREIDRRNGAQK